jgi:hypothetical protein
MEQGKLNRVMIVGKGSLFLGRLTNLFDGVSFILEKNSGVVSQGATGEAVDKDTIRQMIAEAMSDFATALKSE